MRDEVEATIVEAALQREEPPASVAPPPQSRARARLEEAPFVVIESGRIRFYARPRVDLHSAAVAPLASLSDLKCLCFTLAPHIGSCVRRVAVGKKRMPDTKIRERQWAYVDRVGSAAHIVADLGPKTYVTKTRSGRLRRQAEAIEVACGRYAIASHRDHSHLLYELDRHLEDGTRAMDLLLRNLNIVPAASYIVAVFNPEAKTTTPPKTGTRTRRGELGGDDNNAFPFGEPSIYEGGLLDRFRKRRFTPLEPSFLDHEGTELVLIGGSTPRSI